MAVVAVESPTFQPAMRIITAITNNYPAEITTSFAHQYETGMIVQLFVPRSFGMVQADQLQGSIAVTGDTTFEINIDTTFFDPFVIPPDINLPDGTPVQVQYAQVVPVGEVNDILSSATRNVLPYP